MKPAVQVKPGQKRRGAERSAVAAVKPLNSASTVLEEPLQDTTCRERQVMVVLYFLCLPGACTQTLSDVSLITLVRHISYLLLCSSIVRRSRLPVLKLSWALLFPVVPAPCWTQAPAPAHWERSSRLSLSSNRVWAKKPSWLSVLPLPERPAQSPKGNGPQSVCLGLFVKPSWGNC